MRVLAAERVGGAHDDALGPAPPDWAVTCADVRRESQTDEDDDVRKCAHGAHCTIEEYSTGEWGSDITVSRGARGTGVWARRFWRPALAACGSAQPDAAPSGPAWERENPIKPPAPAPLGMEVFFEDVKPPTPASVRLGRWLFYDTRLSADNTVACATCHKPEHAFSEPTPVSTGIRGQKGTPQGADASSTRR